jgi:hypothetical protein
LSRTEAGPGVYYELGFADAHKKRVIGFSLLGVAGLGKAVEGRWAMIPTEYRATTYHLLRSLLEQIQLREKEKWV